MIYNLVQFKIIKRSLNFEKMFLFGMWIVYKNLVYIHQHKNGNNFMIPRNEQNCLIRFYRQHWNGIQSVYENGYMFLYKAFLVCRPYIYTGIYGANFLYMTIFLPNQKTCIMAWFVFKVDTLLQFPCVRLAFSVRLVYK